VPDIFRTSSLPLRSAASGRILAILIVVLALAGCKSELYSKLSEREANEMVALLIKHAIPVERVAAKDGSVTIKVEQSRTADAVEILKASGYPRQSFKNMGEVFKSSGLIASPTEERARFVYALSEELSRTISDIDGVLSARIHVVLPKNDLLRQDTTPSSASVFIRHDQTAPLKTLLPQIKMLVANSIEGLSYEKVSVVLVPVDRTAAIEAASPAAIAKAAQGASVLPLDGSLLAGIGVALATIVGGLGFWLGMRRRPDPSRSVVIVPPNGHRSLTEAPREASLGSPQRRTSALPSRDTERAAA
jgi:type III secretion protein J